MKIRKGDVFLADLNPAFGHEQQGRRPVLVVSNDAANDTLQTVQIAPLTGQVKAARFPSTVLVTVGEAGLAKDSVALLFQIRVLDKRRLQTRWGAVDKGTLEKIDAAIRQTFDL